MSIGDPIRSLHRLCRWLSVPLCLAGCGDDSKAPPKPDSDVKAPVGEDADAPDPTPIAKADVPPAETWADTDDAIPKDDPADAPPDAGESGDAPDKPTAFPGPCTVKWSTGAVLKFTYEADQGEVRIDEDGDGKAETCATFEYAEGRTGKVQIDEGCDGSFESSIVPTYDAGQNFATAVLTSPKEGGGEQTREISLVVLPGYVGLTPGYLVQAPKKSLKVSSKNGQVRSVSVRKPVEGPPVTVSFTYNDDGRVRQIKEDLGSDDTVDRLMYYRYDELGNVVGMKVTLTTGEAQDVGTARLSYACHQQKE